MQILLKSILDKKEGPKLLMLLPINSSCFNTNRYELVQKWCKPFSVLELSKKVLKCSKKMFKNVPKENSNKIPILKVTEINIFLFLKNSGILFTEVFKGQLISNVLLLSSFRPKYQQKFRWISALVSKKRSNKKKDTLYR